MIRATPFPRGIFVSNDGLHGRHRTSVIHPVRRPKTKNIGKRFDRNRLPCFYFHPWNTSSNAFFRAAFMLFSNSRRISNSKVDFFFFFRSCWLLISRAPRYSDRFPLPRLLRAFQPVECRNQSVHPVLPTLTLCPHLGQENSCASYAYDATSFLVYQILSSFFAPSKFNIVYNTALASTSLISHLLQSSSLGICVFRIGLYCRMYSPSFYPISES